MKRATLILVFFTSYFLVNCSSNLGSNTDSNSGPHLSVGDKNSPFESDDLDTLAVTCDDETASYLERTQNMIPQMRQSVSLHQVNQKVVEKDCNGNIKSEKLEIVTEPIRDIFLRPRSNYGRLSSVSLLNPKTCAIANTILPNHHEPTGLHALINGDENGRIRLRVNILPGDFSFQVVDGLNTIYFTYTDPERYGKYELDVYFTQETLKDVKVIEPQDCGSRVVE